MYYLFINFLHILIITKLKTYNFYKIFITNNYELLIILCYNMPEKPILNTNKINNK